MNGMPCDVCHAQATGMVMLETMMDQRGLGVQVQASWEHLETLLPP